MKTEISSGGVIVKRYGAVWHVLMLQDMNDSWTFPKGLVEQGETNEDAAVREIDEEVGLSPVRLLAPLEYVEYFYRRGGLIKKTVYYFLFAYDGQKDPVGQASEGISEVGWFPFVQAVKIVGYAKTNIPLLEKAQKALAQIV